MIKKIYLISLIPILSLWIYLCVKIMSIGFKIYSKSTIYKSTYSNVANEVSNSYSLNGMNLIIVFISTSIFLAGLSIGSAIIISRNQNS